LFALKESDMADDLIDLDKLFKREPPKLLHRQSHYDAEFRQMQQTSLYQDTSEEGWFYIEQETVQTDKDEPGVHFKLPLPPKARVYFNAETLGNLLPHLTAIVGGTAGDSPAGEGG
jgi:hypothetical protein